MLQQFRLLQQSELFVGVSNILQHDLLQQFALLQQHSLFHPAFCLAQASYTSPLLCSTFVPFPAVMVRGVLSLWSSGAGAKQPVPGYDFQLDPLFTPEVIKTVNDVIANSNRTGEKITGWERVGESLIGAKLAWRCHTPPDCAGVHQSNRSSYGLAGSDAQVHGKKILGAGFSWKSVRMLQPSSVLPSRGVMNRSRLMTSSLPSATISSPHWPSSRSCRSELGIRIRFCDR